MTHEITLLGYAVLALSAVCLELGARRFSRWATLPEALAVLRRWWPARVLLFAGWLWLGWHLFVRVHWR